MAESSPETTFKYALLTDDKATETNVKAIAQLIKDQKDCYLIGIAGIPGAGKSELSKALLRELEGSVVVPMDGYHIERKDLSEADMLVRGAPHTFHYKKFRDDLIALKEKREGKFPSFDHSLKDPVYDDIIVTPEHRYVIVEGLYLFIEEWGLKEIFDFQVFLHCDLEATMERLAKRHVATGIEPDLEAAKDKVDRSDKKNAIMILEKSVLPDSVLRVKTG